jgi:hypothetical protein
MQLTNKMARAQYSRRLPIDVHTAADFLVWWMSNYDRTDRLRAAMRWLMSPFRGPNSDVWKDLLGLRHTEMVSALTVERKHNMSADLREYALLVDWMVATQMAELRAGHSTRGQLVHLHID